MLSKSKFGSTNIERHLIAIACVPLQPGSLGHLVLRSQRDKELL